MTNDWIIDVLTDLKKFSTANRLDRLSEQLDDTIMIAGNELAVQCQVAQLVGKGDETRGLTRSAQSSPSA